MWAKGGEVGKRRWPGFNTQPGNSQMLGIKTKKEKKKKKKKKKRQGKKKKKKGSNKKKEHLSILGFTFQGHWDIVNMAF